MKIKVLLTILISILICFFAHAQIGIGHVIVEAKDADGKPLQGVSVRLQSTQKDIKREGATAKNGEATLRFIDFGNYKLTASKEGYKVIHAKFTNRGGTPEAILQARASGRKLESSADIGPDQVLLEIYVNPGFEITYTVTLATDESAQAIWQDRFKATAPTPVLTPEEILAKTVEEIISNAANAEDALNIVREREKKAKLEDILEILARLYEERQDAANALFAYIALAEQTSSNVLWYKIGRISYEQKDYARAISSFEKSVAAAPSDYDSLLGLGLSHEAAGNKDKAIEVYEKTINLHPDKPSPYDGLVELYNATRQYKKAESAHKRLRNLDTSAELTNDASVGPNAIDLYNEGVICLNKGDNVCARKAFESALGVDPNLSEAHFQLGILYMNLGQCSKVIEHFEKFLALDQSKGDPKTAESLIQYCKTQVKK